MKSATRRWVLIWFAGIIGYWALCMPRISLAQERSFLVPDDGEKREVGSVEDHILQPGDRIKITIYPEDEYVKGDEMQISSDGNITLPLIGKIHVVGRGVLETEKIIADIVDQDYLVDPEVVIEVKKLSDVTAVSVVLLGAVRKPGTYEFGPDEKNVTLLKLLSKAGGFSEVANIKRIKIVRESDGGKKVIRANAADIMGGKEPDVELEGGDIVHVAESLF